MAMISLNDFISSNRFPLKATDVKPLRGGCACRKVNYEVSGGPFRTVFCHCPNCRRITGTAYSTNVQVLTSEVRFHGELRQFRAKSNKGPSCTISFCGICSSTLWKESSAEGSKGYCWIQAGTLRQDYNFYLPREDNIVLIRPKVIRDCSEGLAVP